MEGEPSREPLIFERMRQNSLRHQRNFRDQIISDSRKMFETATTVEEQESTEQTIEIVERPFRASVDSLYECQQQQSHDLLSCKSNRKGKQPRQANMMYARRFQVPGWLNCIPEDFEKYIVMLKPAGLRVLLFITNCKVLARDKYGYKQAEFVTDYAGKSSMSTILDAIYNQDTRAYYIMDVIQWKGNFLTGEEFLFRQNWLASNLSPVSAPCSTESCEVRLKLNKPYENTRSTLLQLYTEPAEFRKEGFVFIHPESKYLHRNNQSVLCWKDANTSQYPIDTEDDGQTVSMEVKATGIVSKSGGLFTLDKHKLWQFDANTTNGGYCRFGFTKIVVRLGNSEMKGEEEEEQFVVELQNFRVISMSTGSGKCLADPLSKLIYQYQARHDPLKFETLINKLPH